MSIEDLQLKEEGPWPHMERVIESVNRQWKEGTINETTYHSQLALLYSNMKDVEQCREHAALVPDTARNDDRMNVYVSLARMLIHEDKVEEAIPYYEKTLQLAPDHDMALLEIAECYNHLKQFDEAEKWYKVALSYDSESYFIWYDAGMVASKQAKYEEAIDCFKKAVELDEHKRNIYLTEYCLGLCYGNLQDFYRALSHYTKSLDANPTFAHSLNNIANLYFEHEGDIKTALHYLKQAEAIALADDDEQLLQMLYINIVRLYGITKEFKLQQLYNDKLLDKLGFGGMADSDED